jgi:hypothetical protein
MEFVAAGCPTSVIKIEASDMGEDTV